MRRLGGDKIKREDSKARALVNKSRRDQGLPVLPPAHAEGPAPLTVVPDKPPNETECQRLVREYRESEACFAPYKIANGVTRPEAFEHCKQVDELSIKCGYAKP